MLKLISVIALLLATISWSQEVFEYRGKFGLSLDNGSKYNADYDEIITKEYFNYGKIDKWYYVLSEDKSLSKKGYKKFLFHLLDELLVIGITDENKLDLFDESGKQLLLADSEYSAIESSKNYSDTHISDLLIVKKNGKSGLYNWVKNKEIVPAENDVIKLHSDCKNLVGLIFTKQGAKNRLWQLNGEEIVSFSSRIVDDIYPSNVCEGYILKKSDKVGYLLKKGNQKYFLIKPIYSDIYFPTEDPKTILVEAYGKYGIYHNYRRLLKAKFDEIEVIDGNYIFAVATKHNDYLGTSQSINIDREGRVID